MSEAAYHHLLNILLLLQVSTARCGGGPHKDMTRRRWRLWGREVAYHGHHCQLVHWSMGESGFHIGSSVPLTMKVHCARCQQGTRVREHEPRSEREWGSSSDSLVGDLRTLGNWLNFSKPQEFLSLKWINVNFIGLSGG